VADCRDWFSGVKKVPDELNRRSYHSKLIGIRDPTRQQKSVKVLGLCAVKRHVHFKLVALIEVVPTLHFPLYWRHDLSLRPSLIQRLPRFSHLDLLEPIGNQNCHP
jgi:hypothetical protein